jgi:hypothetical protein
MLSTPAAQGGNKSGVSVTVSVAAAAADGRRSAALTVFSCGPLAPDAAESASEIQDPGMQGCVTQAAAARHLFSVLEGEINLDMRILVDRIIVEAFVHGGRVAYTKSSWLLLRSGGPETV